MGARTWTALAVIAAMAAGCGDAGALGADAGDTTTVADATTIPDATASPDTEVDAQPDVQDDVTADATTAPADVVDASPPSTEPLGGTRPAPVFLPPDYAAGPGWPLVILLHGYSASGPVQDAYLSFHERANAEGFVVLVPDGTKNLAGQQFWDASPATCCAFGQTVDDAGYLLQLIAEAKERFDIDPARVFFFGHSNGGFMAYKMACEQADVVAGVVSLAGSSVVDAADCAPTQPVTVLQVHGTADTTVPYLGAAGFPAATTVVERWAGYDACDDPPEEAASGVDYDANAPGDETMKKLWTGCERGVAVGLWTMVGSGHVPFMNERFVPDALTFLLDHLRAPGSR